MELRHLHHFVAVAETKHFGQAAKRLYLAQPALSQSVRQLETELGVTLLARTTRTVSLTPAGEFFYREATRILESLAESVRGVKRITDGRLGLVRIGFTGTAAFDQLPAISRALKQRLPGVALEVHGDLLTPAQVEGLRSEHLDLAVLRPPVAGDDLVVRTIASESLLLALPADHRLADQPALEVLDVTYEDFVMYSDSHSAVNEAVVRSCRTAGFTPRREHEAPDTSVLLALVAAGLGIALVPESVRALKLDGVVFRDIAGVATIDLALAWRQDNSTPLVESLVRALEEAGILPSMDTSPPQNLKDIS
ncbi:LysR family transcriptional regulator [Rhodococcus sp. BP-252]|uniref:LysR family transcriptional regulator n=1 Tax=unclassified Rhodococcus (in: high G+C Gram-positive bacteria) TaxID=192944 RepID=UPI001C9AF765|nr:MULTISPECIES: LysR family transcriptional regulator [unclassified Rhodococcus (in: high G+C Gram-positive bacteria)]MBY6412812.1 LysR family transcriptional regulator [Rhodococcus sp. BP-320]MBY6417651.1 LysR family transcriptional regulator [Rhodococcus sp. BP-321]MBY6423503.1 LysR family transcriptional regulator [Rhodococcus sp. BP-324]MBY6427675.1 LysR family transcriptional regulator [Rhodococcus sp. BP-323]MBY6432839.1 LysR family transcriptional regulator [Rhodococcus sp. BP-322]